MSGHSTAYLVEEMGYNHYLDTKNKTKVLSKGGLGSNDILENYHENRSKTCTHRPSLPSKEGISRNKVGVIEIAPNIYFQNIAYNQCLLLTLRKNTKYYSAYKT
jgi:hypothetical protein